MLTDRDAASAAQAAAHDRVRPRQPAWELYGSQPVNPPRRERDAGDAILKLGQAERDIRYPATRVRHPEPGAGRDYGTGPAYDIGNMRRDV